MTQREALRAIGQRIRSVRERLHMTQEAVAERLGIPRSAVSEIETGKRELSATELFTLSLLFGEPAEHLLGLVESASEEDLVMLRADAVTATDRVALNRFVHKCREYQELEEITGERREPDLRTSRTILSAFEQAWRLADEERKRLELGAAPAHQLIQVLEERVGIKVFFLELGDQISGASIRSPRFGPALLVNRGHVPGRRVFTAAHEFFHLLTEGRVARSKGPEAIHVCTPNREGGRKDRADQLADQFAGRLLLPPEHFLEQLRALESKDGHVNPFDLNRVGQYFGVSTQAVFVQMAAQRLIPWEKAKQIYGDAEFQERLVKDRGEEVGPEPRRFMLLAVKAFLMHQISRARLAELLDINVAQVDGVIREVGGAGGMRDGIKLSLSR